MTWPLFQVAKIIANGDQFPGVVIPPVDWGEN